MAGEVQAEAFFTSTLRRRARSVRQALRPPSAAGVRRFVRLVSSSVDRLNAQARLEEDRAGIVRAGVLHEAFLSLLYVREGRISEAAHLLAGNWRALAGSRVTRRPVQLRLPPVELEETDPLLLELFGVAVTEEMLAVSRSTRGRQTIRRLMTALRVSYDDLGRMLGVSGETVRRWARGTVEIPETKLAALDIAGQALSRLLRLFRLDRLAEVMRRPADAFGGQRAIDWALQGRLQEVADRYERELAYQL